MVIMIKLFLSLLGVSSMLYITFILEVVCVECGHIIKYRHQFLEVIALILCTLAGLDSIKLSR